MRSLLRRKEVRLKLLFLGKFCLDMFCLSITVLWTLSFMVMALIDNVILGQTTYYGFVEPWEKYFEIPFVLTCSIRSLHLVLKTLDK